MQAAWRSVSSCRMWSQRQRILRRCHSVNIMQQSALVTCSIPVYTALNSRPTHMKRETGNRRGRPNRHRVHRGSIAAVSRPGQRQLAAIPPADSSFDAYLWTTNSVCSALLFTVACGKRSVINMSKAWGLLRQVVDFITLDFVGSNACSMQTLLILSESSNTCPCACRFCFALLQLSREP